MKRMLSLLLALLGSGLWGAELRFDFAQAAEGDSPAGFTNLVAGTGSLGDWRVVWDEVPSMMEPLTAQAPSTSKRLVLGQVSKERVDERFPMLAYEGERFGDFTLTTRFKIVGGEMEQMAGIAFRIQDERNFYVIRASALGRNVRFYKVVGGERSAPIGPELEIKTGQWQELKIECKGSEIRCWLNGKAAFPPLNDLSFRAGRIAYWTKSDSVSYFADTVIQYTPQVPLGQSIVNEVAGKQSRLLALKLYAWSDGTNECRVIASKDESEVGELGGKYELLCLGAGQIFHSKSSSHAAMVMPVRDRNGDVVAAARIHMTTFPGQTERNALTRATPIVKAIEARIQAQHDPLK